jgi:hypothetical protein
MASLKHVSVSDRDAYRRTVTSYASQGYATIHNDGDSTTLSRKKSFNWVLAIILLFIPIIGWIALGAMLLASGRGNDVVEVTLKSNDPSFANPAIPG